MRDLDTPARRLVANADVAAETSRTAESSGAPRTVPPRSPCPESRRDDNVPLPHASRFAHPFVLVDPRPESLSLARALRARGVPLVALSARRLEPVMYARHIDAHRMPPLATGAPQWQARLLELAAKLEPRPLLFACSRPALDMLLSGRTWLQPHFRFANAQPLCSAADEPPKDEPESVLRRTLRRGEAALEVQMTRDRAGRRSGACVLAWAPGAAPDVLVTCVEGRELLRRSDDWLAARDYVGYARLVWAPDRFGRLALQATSSIPGPSLALAVQTGVDLPALAYAAAAGVELPEQRPLRQLTRRLPVAEPGFLGDASPLVELTPCPAALDPLPWMASLLRSLVRA